MKPFFILLIALVVFPFALRAQVKIGDNPQSINANAILELESTTKALLLPRLNNTQIQAMQNVPAGMLVYNSTDDQLYIRTSTSWTPLLSTATSATSAATGWTVNGNAVYTTNLNSLVGVGTTDPQAFLNVPQGRTVLFGRDTLAPDGKNGNALKLIWYGSLGAFRAGVLEEGKTINSAVWNNENVGYASFASGINTLASNTATTSMGLSTSAIGEASVSMGEQTIASGNQAVSMGYLTKAIGPAAVSMGDRTVASGDVSSSMGRNTLASGNAAISMGLSTTASGLQAVSIGEKTIARGNQAVSMGNSTSASGDQAVSMGDQTIASGNQAVSVGNRNVASGDQAISMGLATTASGNHAVSMGLATSASGLLAVSMGQSTHASGDIAVSMGWMTYASGLAAVSMGLSTLASGAYAVGMGRSTHASGAVAISMGDQTRASGEVATSTGYKTVASGDYSTAMGANVSSNGKTGSFIIGDKNDDASLYNNSADNQMMMRFGGGYVLYTNNGTFNGATALGAELKAGQNAWSVVSDSTRKENFRVANGADFLQKIARMRLGSWNYKGQDKKRYRHYGPMAQDFFAAFGHDELGVIGEEKTINQADFDGVNLIAIQALIKKVEKLEAENSTLKAESSILKQQLQQETASLRSELDAIKRLLSSQPSLSPTVAK